MTIKQQIEADLKQAMLSGDKVLTTTLRGLKSSILDEEIAKNLRETGLSDDQTIPLLQKEAKKRQESADLFARGGNDEKHQAELDEKVVIEKYLPAPMSEDEIKSLIDEAVSSTNASGMQAMGQIIGLVKQKIGPAADGSVIARLVKEKLQ
ncbi:MAG TPA: GatB/YqeY domain-containing protein [Patescibacteria group bacterium]|nr:GatB/YqeY domain-containing protein [Patescibacteria group bacterium]